MKIGVISDTHLAGGGLHPKKMASRIINQVSESLEDLARLVRPHFTGVDLILHAGDFVCYDVITALEEFAPVEGVAGNMDTSEISSRLPGKKVVSVGGLKIGLVHGWGAPAGLPEKLRREFEDVDCIVFGHTHHPFQEKVGGIFMFNPGSPTDRRWAASHSIGLLQLGPSLKSEIIPLP